MRQKMKPAIEHFQHYRASAVSGSELCHFTELFRIAVGHSPRLLISWTRKCLNCNTAWKSSFSRHCSAAAAVGSLTQKQQPARMLAIHGAYFSATPLACACAALMRELREVEVEDALHF